MKTYRTLIKLQKIEIDRVKKELLKLNLTLEELHQTLQKLDDELANESHAYNAYNQNSLVNTNFDHFYQVNRHKYENVRNKIPLLEEQISLKREELQAYFSELKKIEHILEGKVFEQKAQRNKKEQQELDAFIKKAI